MKPIVIKNDPSIKKCTAITILAGRFPTRTVLRYDSELVHSYVVHTEELAIDADGEEIVFKHESFYDGHYFKNFDDALDYYEKHS